MKKNIRDYKANGKQFAYLLDCITPFTYSEEDGEQYIDNPTDEQRIRFLVDSFNAYDYENNAKRFPNRAERIGWWMQGLPSGINIDFWQVDIVKLGKSWGYCKTEKKEEEFASNWFKVLGYRACQIADYYHIQFKF